MNAYEQANRDRLARLIAALPRCAAPHGWRHQGTLAVGGLAEIGFSRASDLLLVVSSSGRSVIDCASGQKIARDDEDGGDWYRPLMLTCEGIGPLAGETIGIAGLHGGGLPTSNRFGESLTCVALAWPKSDVIFCAPGASPLVDGHQAGCDNIGPHDDIRACGFSWTGNTLVIATSADVAIFTRAPA